MAARNFREQVASSDVALTTSVQAPSIVQAPADRKAAALAKFFSVVQDPVAEQLDRMKQKAVLAGSQAALSGVEPTAKQKKRDNFMAGYTKIKNDSALVDVQREAAALYENSPNKDNPEALAQELDGLYKKHFGGLDPEVDLEKLTLNQVNPAWQRIVAGINEKATADATARVQQDVEQSASNIAGAQYASAGTLNFQELNAKLLPLVGGQRTNDLLVQQAVDLAIRHGDPTLIDKLPAKWDSGAPGPASLPKYTDTIRNAREAATNQRAHAENVAREEASRQLKQDQETAAAGVVGEILGGQNVTTQVQQLVQNGALTSTAAREIISFQRTFGDTRDDGSVNVGASARIEAAIYKHQFDNVEDVIAATQSVGAGIKGRQEATRLLGLYRAQRNDPQETPEVKGYRDLVEAQTKTKQSIFSLDFDGSQARADDVRKATALRLFNEMIAKGVKPEKAAADSIAAVPEVDVKANLPPTAAAATALLRARVAAGEITEAEAIQLLNK